MMREEQAKARAQQEETKQRLQAKQQERDQTIYNLDTAKPTETPS